jgi:gamma-glutamylputrescine oxidase
LPHRQAAVGTGAALARDLEGEVTVIGAGYSGLAASYALKKRGTDCAGIDANRIGRAHHRRISS